MSKKLLAHKRARSRWFGELLPLSDLASLATNAERADELWRRVDLIEQQERAKPDPCAKLLAEVVAVRQRIRSVLLGDDSSPPPPPKKSA